MEKSVTPSFLKHFTQMEARALNPLTLAYIGDSVFSDYIRKYLLSQGLQNVNHLTKASIDFVRAEAQAFIVKQLLDSTLSEEEQNIVRRGRNTRSHVPKNASVMDYRYATGFEALLGYLSLTGQQQRLEELIHLSITCIENNRKK